MAKNPTPEPINDTQVQTDLPEPTSVDALHQEQTSESKYMVQIGPHTYSVKSKDAEDAAEKAHKLHDKEAN